jgi:hypothetical protein
LDLKLQEMQPLEHSRGNSQLNSTLQALYTLLANDIDSDNSGYYCGAVSMCSSAILALHTPSFIRPDCRSAINHLSPEQKLQRIKAWKEAADQVFNLRHYLLDYGISAQLSNISPMVPDSIFQAAILYRFLWLQTGELKYFNALELMRKSLEFLGRRWGLACIYLYFLLAFYDLLCESLKNFANRIGCSRLLENDRLGDYGSKTSLAMSRNILANRNLMRLSCLYDKFRIQGSPNFFPASEQAGYWCASPNPQQSPPKTCIPCFNLRIKFRLYNPNLYKPVLLNSDYDMERIQIWGVQPEKYVF